MEIAASAVAAARARTPEAELRRYDGARLPWEDGTWDVGVVHAFSRTSARGLVARAGLELLGELTDPLGRDVHRWTSGPGRGDAKWLVRAALHAASPALVARLFTLRWTAACPR